MMKDADPRLVMNGVPVPLVIVDERALNEVIKENSI
jgi:hypothetical protein